jgi:hypothetical protein
MTDAAVQVSRARPAISRRLWHHCVTLPAAAPPALGSRVSSGDAATLPNLAGHPRPAHGRIRAARRTPFRPHSLVITSRRTNLTTPRDPGDGSNRVVWRSWLTTFGCLLTRTVETTDGNESHSPPAPRWECMADLLVRLHIDHTTSSGTRPWPQVVDGSRATGTPASSATLAKLPMTELPPPSGLAVRRGQTPEGTPGPADRRVL